MTANQGESVGRRLVVYLPTAIAGAVMLWLVAYGVYVLRGRNLDGIRPRHIVNGLLLWFVLSPVLIGMVRGFARGRRGLVRS